MNDGLQAIKNKTEAPGFLAQWSQSVISSFLGRPLVCFLLFGVLGAYTGYYLDGWLCGSLFFIVLTFSVAVISLNWKDRSKLITGFVALVSFLILFSYFSVKKARSQSLSDSEDYSGICVVKSRNAGKEGYKYISLELESGEKVAWLTNDTYSYGDRLELKGLISKIHAQGNPGDMDKIGYFKRSGIFRSIEVMNIHACVPAVPTLLDQGYRLGEVIRNACYTLWQRVSDEETAMFLSAMLVGDSSHLDDSVKERFKDCNLYHMLVVSGAHVGYFTSTIAIAFSVFSHNKKKRTIFMGILLGLFGFVTGWANSATRSILSYFVISLLSFEKRRVDRCSSCALSGIILMLLDPFSVFSQGLLLSFGATFSIMTFEHRMTVRLKKSVSFLPEEVLRAISCFLCAHFGMLPVLLSMGNPISVIKLIVIILAGFPAELICSLGLVFTTISLLIPFASLASLLFMPVSGLVLLLNLLTQLGEIGNFTSFSIHNQSWVVVVLTACLFLVLVCKCGFRKRVVSFLLSVTVVIQSCEILLRKSDDSVRVLFLDVGQGDSALISCNGRHYLIDGGNVGCGEKIQSVMKYLDVSRIDAAFASHLDSDHIAGIIELYELGCIDNFYTPYWGDSDEMEQLKTVFEKLPENTEILIANSEYVVDENIVLHIVWPRTPRSGGNEDSMVIWAEILGTNILFTGDIGEDTENVLEETLPQDIQVLKVAHHGSRFSTGTSFLDSKNIDAAVISVGYNFYGHPSKETLSRLGDHGISIFRTDLSGCVQVNIKKNSWDIGYYFS